MKQALRFRDSRSPRLYKGELREILGDVTSVAAKLALPPEVNRRAVAICANAITTRLGHGIPHHVLAAASLYVGCREGKKPVTLRDLAEASSSDVREVGRCYVSLLEGMHISRPALNGKGYVYHLALKRPVSEQALRLSQETIRVASSKALGGRNPMTLAAASLYLACCTLGEAVTQAELAEAAGVGEESVRECCRAIRLLSRPGRRSPKPVTAGRRA